LISSKPVLMIKINQTSNSLMADDRNGFASTFLRWVDRPNVVKGRVR